MNTNFRYSIFLKDGIIYSDVYPQNDLTNMLKSDKENRWIRFPFPEDFNWKHYYDKFIDVILDEYDSGHIILIRTNSARWYMDGDEISHFDLDASRCKHMVEQIDEYFIERTGCMCIDEQYNHIPHEKIGSAFPYAISSQYTYKMYFEKIVDIIKNNNIKHYIAPSFNGSEFVKFLFTKLSSDIVNANFNEIEIISKNATVNINQVLKIVDKGTDFYKNLVTLKQFLDPETAYYLSDYVIEYCEKKKQEPNAGIDVELIKSYAKYFKLDINDIIAVYKISVELDQYEIMKGITANILNNTDCLPLKSAMELREKNIRRLTEYSYKNFEIDTGVIPQKYYIRVENNVFFVLGDKNKPFEKVKVLQAANYMDIIENGYVCSVNDVEMLCSSLSFYIERAKRGTGNTPITVKYDSYDEFYDSLFYVVCVKMI